MSIKVPNRFLGYAFCVGDLLIEADTSFDIKNADGAVKSTLGIIAVPGANANFLDLLDTKGRGLIKRSVGKLTGSNRVGPLMVNVGHAAHEKELFGVFLAKLPADDDAIYIVLSRPSRLGLKEQAEQERPTVEKKKEFFQSLENLFEQDPSAEDKVQVTVVDAGQGEELSRKQQSSIERLLKSVSYGGRAASQVGEDKFAVVHERSNADASADAISKSISQSAGVEVKAATIDAAEAQLSEKDNMRALVFSLQQFTEDGEGFDIDSIDENCTALICETTERVAAFRKVLEEGAFTLVYQPIVDMKRGTTHHFEALTRFDLPPLMKSQ